MCISKGKAHKRYEFGQKFSVATSNRGNWGLGMLLCQGPHRTSGRSLAQGDATTARHFPSPASTLSDRVLLAHVNSGAYLVLASHPATIDGYDGTVDVIGSG